MLCGFAYLTLPIALGSRQCFFHFADEESRHVRSKPFSVWWSGNHSIQMGANASDSKAHAFTPHAAEPVYYLKESIQKTKTKNPENLIVSFYNR